MGAYCLTIHAGYRCADSGACCAAGWAIPVEPHVVSGLHARRVAPHGTVGPARFVEGPGRHGERRLYLAADADGRCEFHDAGDRFCRVHREAGPGFLPSACRDFPRVTLRDGRGIFITLSHFCPTAARLLLTSRHIAIIPAPRALSLDGRVEGLDAVDVLPPLLRPGMLTDLQGYAAWERAAIAVLNTPTHSAASALAAIRRATVDVVSWSPGQESLAERVGAAFERARLHNAAGAPVGQLEHAARAFLASHLFGSWAAYQQGGLQAVLDAVAIAHAAIADAIDDEDAFLAAVRAADLRLRHSLTPPAPAGRDPLPQVPVR